MQTPDFHRESEVIRDALATPFEGNTFPERTFGGCVYRPDGSRVDLSLRNQTPQFRFVQKCPEQLDLSTAQTARQVPGRTLYLGHYIPQFGHFLSESLSAFWILEEQDIAGFDQVAFHILGHGPGLTSYTRYCLETFGIDPDRVLFLNDGTVRFDEITVPARLARLGAGAHPSMAWVYAQIRARAVAEAPDETPDPVPERIYISRRRMRAGKASRFVANEVRLEELFTRYGFHILYPESLGFTDQIRLSARTRIIAGLTGSGLANSLFMPPGGTLIQLLTPRYGIDSADVHYSQAAGHRDLIVPFRGFTQLNDLITHYDVAYVEEHLRRDLGLEPLAEVPGNRLQGALEIGMHDLRIIRQAAAGRLERLIGRSKRALSGGGR